MRNGLRVFDFFLPGIVAGMILAGVVLGVGDAMFPDAFQKVFPRETFQMLAVGIGTASIIGLVNLLVGSRKNEDRTQNDGPPREQQSKDGFRSGGTNGL